MSSVGMREESVQRAKAVFNTIKGWLISMNAAGPHQGPGVPEKVRGSKRSIHQNLCTSWCFSVALTVAWFGYGRSLNWLWRPSCFLCSFFFIWNMSSIPLFTPCKLYGHHESGIFIENCYAQIMVEFLDTQWNPPLTVSVQARNILCVHHDHLKLLTDGIPAWKTWHVVTFWMHATGCGEEMDSKQVNILPKNTCVSHTCINPERNSLFPSLCSWPGKMREMGETTSRFYADLMGSDTIPDTSPPTHGNGARSAAKASSPSQRRSGAHMDFF